MKLSDYTTAKTLRELGYDGVYYYYVDDDGSYTTKGSLLGYDWQIPAPRLDDVAYWIRDKHGLSIEVGVTSAQCWIVYIVNKSTFKSLFNEVYNTYNDALEEAVTKAIEIIKNRNNEN